MKLSFVFLGLAVATGGCSSKEETPDPYASVAQFCLAWGQSACTSTTVLNCSGEETQTDALTQACVAKQEAFCEGLLQGTGYRSAQAVSCLNAVQRAYSDGKLTALEIATVRHRGDPCNHLIKGPQLKGGTCTQDDDCDTLQNYQCVIKGDAGTCQIPLVVDNGTACDAPDAICNPKFYCDGNCVASKGVGAKCTADLECDPALVCDPDASKCVAKVAPTSCAKDSDCTLESVCDIPLGASTGMCVKSITLGASEALCEDLR